MGSIINGRKFLGIKYIRYVKSIKYEISNYGYFIYFIYPTPIYSHILLVSFS